MSVNNAKVTGQAPPLLLIEALRVETNSPVEPVTILDGVCLQISNNETFALIGESGCGKTMTALATLGLLPINVRTYGAVIFQGKNLRNIAEQDLNQIRGRHIAMIFQHAKSAFNPTFTIGTQMVEVICTHLQLRKIPARARALDLLAEIGLPDPDFVFNAYPHQLSGGMAQRAMIAMGLSCGPQLVIADEPTSALDSKTQREIVRLLRHMQKNYGFTLWLISHDLALVAKIADKIAVMKDGCIIESGSAATLLQKPRHAYTKLLLSQCKINQAQPQKTRAPVTVR